jgi:hypothetical protein
MNYLLGQMQQLGHLTRDDDPEDQRFKRVRLAELPLSPGRSGLHGGLRAAPYDMRSSVTDWLGRRLLAHDLRIAARSLVDALRRSQERGVLSRRTECRVATQ